MDSISFYNILENSSLEEFGDYFFNAKTSAFRLELLQIFDVLQEQKALQEFIDKGKLPVGDFNSDWHNILKKGRQRNCEFERVRFISYPITDYLKFEISCGYPDNLKYGEKIYVLDNEKINLNSLQSPVPILKDFWLFDEEDCFLMEYDFAGKFLGVSKVPGKYVDTYSTFKEEVKSKSIEITQTKVWRHLI